MSSFSKAFASARNRLGPGKVFTWKGKRYSTDTKEDRAKRKAVTKPTARPTQKVTKPTPRPTKTTQKKTTKPTPRPTIKARRGDMASSGVSSLLTRARSSIMNHLGIGGRRKEAAKKKGTSYNWAAESAKARARREKKR